jgi:cell division protein FtsI/penicillin-binding protein 2
MAYTLGKAADRLVKNHVQIPENLYLTIDYFLNNVIQSGFIRYSHTNPVYRKKEDITATKVLAADVMEPFSGEILAIPTWPSYDPGDPEFEKMLQKLSPQDKSKILKNNNFKNHAIGATIKPLIFSIAAAGFWGKMDPGQLVIYHKKEPGSNIGLSDVMCPHTNIGKIPISGWDCLQPGCIKSNSSEYLIYSRNYNDIFMGMLGMLLEKEDWNRILIPDHKQPDIEYQGRKYAVDFTKVKESPFTLNDEYPVPRTAAMNDTILFQGLKELFDVGFSEKPRYIPIIKSFCGCFTDRGWFFQKEPLAAGGENSIQYIVPEVVNIRPKDFQKLRQDLIPFFFGGRKYQWNNIQMVEAYSRLVTGLRVKAVLEKDKVEAEKPSPMPEPLGKNSFWKTTNLFAPLEKVGEIGEARVLKNLVASPYRLILKTGTVQEGENRPESEMLFFTIGKWDENIRGFVPGLTLSCFLYMQDSKTKNGEMKKFELAKPIIVDILRYLKF